MKTIGIITYNHRHLKTEQVLFRFLESRKNNIKVYALPFVERPARKVLFTHRPSQSVAVHPAELCNRYGVEFIPVDKDARIDNTCDLYLVAGAGILSKECLTGKRILNAHPGVIPAVRGLDAFKWSIYNMAPLGVTLHYIDEQVDIGEIVSIIPTPVFQSDTLESLARRHYENEISVIADFEKYMASPCNPYKGIAMGERMHRMKSEMETDLSKKFEFYKQEYVNGTDYRKISGGGIAYKKPQLPYETNVCHFIVRSLYPLGKVA